MARQLRLGMPSFEKDQKQRFSSRFEERQVFGYLKNLIDSEFLSEAADELSGFLTIAMGEECLVDMAKKRFPAEFKEKDPRKSLIGWLRCDMDLEFPVITGFFREEIYEAVSERYRRPLSRKECDTERRLSIMQKSFDLKREEVEMVSFYFLKKTSHIVECYLGNQVADFGSLSTLRSSGHILLGLERKAFLDALSGGNLFKAQILARNNREIELTSWCIDYLSGLAEEDISHEFFKKEVEDALDVSYFDVSEDEMMVVDALLTGNGRQNILLYGAQGTGKTSFARSLAKKYGRELYSVKTPETDDHKDRLRAIFATVNMADREKAIVLVDEADEVLNSSKSIFFESKTNKSWINQFLESHEKKVIWITNRSSEVDPSTMRRFSFSMEFKKLNKDKRLKVIKYEIKKKGLEEYFSDGELKDLCTTYNVDAGGIVNAINTLNVATAIDRENTIRKITAVLKNHAKATGDIAGTKREREFDVYTLEGLNTSCNLRDVVSSLRSYEGEGNRKKISLNILLHGMPGTGKSEFVYYIGDRLGKEVILKRCSEIQSMYVGETEKNIARAFVEAKESGGILFFDEADSFLFPRKEAHRSWEKNFTNEILTQMENHNGVVMFATNDIEGLDHAAMRRFRFKIEFRPLTPDGNVHFYNRLLSGFVDDNRPLSEDNMRLLKEIRNLTPGDFAVVRDQMVFMKPADLNHTGLIEALANEVRYKKGIGKGIGF